MDPALEVRRVFGVILVVLVAAPSLVMSTKRYGMTDELPATAAVPEVNLEEDITSNNDSLTGRAGAEGPRLALLLPLLLPLLLGLGLLQATLFHTATFYVIGSLKTQPERWGRWRLTAAGVLGAACGAQVLLMAGMVLVALRMHSAMNDGSFAAAGRFAAFYPGHEVWNPLKPFMWATPVLIVCYWIMLTILCKVEVKKKKRREDQKEKLVEGTIDIPLLKVTKL